MLQITAADSSGQQFNGLVLNRHLRKLGHSADLAVLHASLGENHVFELAQGPLISRINPRLTKLEERLGLQSLLPVASLSLYRDPRYLKADLVHLQVPHGVPMLSLFNLPIMSRQKAMLWTIHDPWLSTGHCIYPLDCNRWQTGCGKCPDLSRHISVSRDRTHFMWRIKKTILQHSKLHLVLASPWMMQFVAQSPILRHLPRHHIPHGVDTEIYKPGNKDRCRQELGIPLDAQVLLFRVPPPANTFKGVEQIKAALAALQLKRPTWLLVLDEIGRLEELRSKYQIMELGWLNDSLKIAKVFAAADVFLMPSSAEAFGLMAVEAMASGTPVIVAQGTALPQVVQAPRGGLAVPQNDAPALAAAIESIFDAPALKQKLIENALEIVRENYTVELYVQRHLELYKRLLHGG